MGYCVTSFTFFLLFIGILTQVVSFLTSHMQDNKIINENKGIFVSCIVGRCFWFDFKNFTDKTRKK